jgi:hypothetical protein
MVQKKRTSRHFFHLKTAGTVGIWQRHGRSPTWTFYRLYGIHARCVYTPPLIDFCRCFIHYESNHRYNVWATGIKFQQSQPQIFNSHQKIVGSLRLSLSLNDWCLQCTNRSISPYCIRRLGSGLFRHEACTTMQKVPLKKLGSGSTQTRLSPGRRGQPEAWCRDARWRRKLIDSSEITGQIFSM